MHKHTESTNQGFLWDRKKQQLYMYELWWENWKIFLEHHYLPHLQLHLNKHQPTDNEMLTEQNGKAFQRKTLSHSLQPMQKDFKQKRISVWLQIMFLLVEENKNKTFASQKNCYSIFFVLWEQRDNFFILISLWRAMKASFLVIPALVLNNIVQFAKFFE